MPWGQPDRSVFHLAASLWPSSASVNAIAAVVGILFLTSIVVDQLESGTGEPDHDSAAGMSGGPGRAHDADNARRSAVPRPHHHTAEQCDGIIAAVRAISDRPTGRGMDDLGVFLAKVALRIPFGFAHFNDGEIIAARSSEGRTDRGQQQLSPGLRASMQRALALDRPGFYAGLPCALEWGEARRWADGVYGGNRSGAGTQTTVACVFINGNYGLARRFLVRLLHIIRAARIRIVVSRAADIKLLQRTTGLNFIEVMRIPERDAFPAGYDLHKDAVGRFGDGDVVIICAGPTGRILAAEWYARQPNVTYIELGSFFDPDIGVVITPDMDSSPPGYYKSELTPCDRVDDLRTTVDPILVEKAAWCTRDIWNGLKIKPLPLSHPRAAMAAAAADGDTPEAATGSVEMLRAKATVVISSFRSDLGCLLKQIELWQRCPALVHSIRLNRFHGDTSYDQAWVDSVSAPGGPNVIIDHLENKLTHRFLPRDFATAAVFTVDVDTFYSCDALRTALTVWRRHPRSAVGFHARQLQHDGNDEVWDASYPAPYRRNMLLVTKGALQHVDAFSAYFDARYAEYRREVDAALTGEDFLMGFVQARELDPVVRFVCLDNADSCHANCNRRVGALQERTGHTNRTALLGSLFRGLGGSALPNQTGTETMHFARDYGDGLCHSYPAKPFNYGACTESSGLKPDLTPPWAMAAGLWDHGGL